MSPAHEQPAHGASAFAKYLVALGLPLRIPPSSGSERHVGSWSPAALGLADGGTSLGDMEPGRA
jgi:hypothetical protein